MSPSQRSVRLRELEQRMYQHARDLEFEEAAKVRDQIRRLKDASLAG
jgi:excinuclease ABC subunit B